MRFIPHLLICDTTNILFNTAWLLRLGNLRGTVVVSILEVLFAISFLLVRAIHMPTMFVALGLLHGTSLGENRIYAEFLIFASKC